MICTHCGTEIADKAIVCFRCGQSTADPGRARPASQRPAAKPFWVALTGLLVLVAAALLMARAATGQLPASVSYGVAALAAVVLIWRIVRRRRT